jgi:hypothetical protein
MQAILSRLAAVSKVARQPGFERLRETCPEFSAANDRISRFERSIGVIAQRRYVQDSNQPGSARTFACMRSLRVW